MSRIYLDYAATTPPLSLVKEAMSPWLEVAANPSSLHAEGRRAREAVDSVREVVCRALGCLFGEVTFTSSGTEAMNQAILGLAAAQAGQGRDRVLIGSVEHHCALATTDRLRAMGYAVDQIPVDRDGRYVLDSVGEDVLLVVAQHANNELGTVQPVESIARMAHEAGAMLLVDAVQTFPFGPGERQSSVGDLGADMLAVSAHKCYGPTGVGALYVRGGLKPDPLIVGGGQEREARAGTENVAGIVGFGAAVQALGSLTANRAAVRDAFLRALPFDQTVKSVEVLPGHAHIRVPGIDAETVLIKLDRAGVSASSGAACSSGSLEPSHVLLACGYTKQEAAEGLRFTFGIDTTIDQSVRAADQLVKVVEEIRESRA